MNITKISSKINLFSTRIERIYEFNNSVICEYNIQTEHQQKIYSYIF